MKKFILLYNMPLKDAHTEEGKAAWMKWFESLSDKMVDMGNPLVRGKEVFPDEVKDIVPESRVLSGYGIVNAEDMDEAIEIAQGCPSKAGILVYEAMSM